MKGIMKKSFMFLIVIIATFLGGLTITGLKLNNTALEDKPTELPQPIYSYWKSNKAEISSYTLKQVRYGEIRNGHAVMIFVTEPFLPRTQVKYDGYEVDENPVEVLKLNFERYFTTGIYQYSLMSSIFSPFTSNPSHPYKITTSSQDWCGQSFLQLNNRDDKFEINSYSYFQSPGDQMISLEKNILEDELWNKIRLDYESLPIGEINIIPSTQFLRFVNSVPKAYTANAKLTVELDEESGTEIFAYNVNYIDYERTLTIYFERDMPNKILGWEETDYQQTSNGEKSLMTTEAKLLKTLNIDYWNKNSNADSIYRTELGL